MPPEKSKFTLRPAASTDINGITKCAQNAYQKYIDRIGIPPKPMLEDYSQVIGKDQVWIAEISGEVVGFIVLTQTDEGFLLDNVAVDPSYSGLGVGRALINFGEAEAQRQGYKSLYLYTNNKMHENQALYKRYGYIEYDRRVDEKYDRVFMRKVF